MTFLTIGWCPFFTVSAYTDIYSTEEELYYDDGIVNIHITDYNETDIWPRASRMMSLTFSSYNGKRQIQVNDRQSNKQETLELPEEQSKDLFKSLEDFKKLFATINEAGNLKDLKKYFKVNSKSIQFHDSDTETEFGILTKSGLAY